MPRSRGRSAAKKNPHPRLEEIVRDLAIDRFVRVRDPTRRSSCDELTSVNMSAHRPAPLDRFAKDRVAPGVAHRHLNEIHFFTEGHGLRPAIEELSNLLRREIAARGFKLRRR